MTLWLIAAALLAAGAVVPAVSGWRPGDSAGPRARARSAHARLGHELATGPVPSGSERERLVAEATERWTTSGGVLAQARSARQFRLAERLAGEGLECLRRAGGGV